VNNKAEDNNRLESSNSTVKAEHVSTTAAGTSTSALGDEPTYDEQGREDIECGDFFQVTDRADCGGNVGR
jgi:hypothetical protein